MAVAPEKKVSALSLLNDPQLADRIIVNDDPAGTPITKQAELGVVLARLLPLAMACRLDYGGTSQVNLIAWGGSTLNNLFTGGYRQLSGVHSMSFFGLAAGLYWVYWDFSANTSVRVQHTGPSTQPNLFDGVLYGSTSSRLLLGYVKWDGTSLYKTGTAQSVFSLFNQRQRRLARTIPSTLGGTSLDADESYKSAATPATLSICVPPYSVAIVGAAANLHHNDERAVGIALKVGGSVEGSTRRLFNNLIPTGGASGYTQFQPQTVYFHENDSVLPAFLDVEAVFWGQSGGTYETFEIASADGSVIEASVEY
ncbi:Hypothetical protein PBC10988_23190 [Planctomycetales bacterium 10988]|nr:Hypothetical protein PBC10988_23190 [Planctomycetales bacterium 10988]